MKKEEIQAVIDEGRKNERFKAMAAQIIKEIE